MEGFPEVSGGFRGFPLFRPYSRGAVLLRKMYHFGCKRRSGKRLELTIIKILIENISVRVHEWPWKAVGAGHDANAKTCKEAEAQS